MIRKNKRIGKITSLIAFLAILSFGCSGNKNKEDDTIGNLPQQQDALIETEPEEVVAFDDSPKEEPVNERITFRQSPSAAKDNKLVIDASSVSFRELDKNNDNIVGKYEFYDGIFSLADVDGNGSITEEELSNTKEELFIENRQSRFASFSDWDEDSDGKISKNEFEMKMASIVDVDEADALAKNVYIIWDQDNDEKIERLELENVIVRLDPDDN